MRFEQSPHGDLMVLEENEIPFVRLAMKKSKIQPPNSVENLRSIRSVFNTLLIYAQTSENYKREDGELASNTQRLFSERARMAVMWQAIKDIDEYYTPPTMPTQDADIIYLDQYRQNKLGA